MNARFHPCLIGETEEQFQRTLALVREVGFDRLNTAAYSPRPATPAAAWTGQLADMVKLDRLNRLNVIAHEVAEERAQRFLGRDLEVPNYIPMLRFLKHTVLTCLCRGVGNMQGSLEMLRDHSVHREWHGAVVCTP